MGLVLMPDDGFGFRLGLGKGIKARSRILDGRVELDLGLYCNSGK